MSFMRRAKNISTIFIIGKDNSKVNPSDDDVTGAFHKINRDISAESKSFKKSLFGEQLYPILFLFTMSGALPISRSPSGWQFKIWSPLFLYCACVYCSVIPLTVNLFYQMAAIFYKAEDFDSKLYIHMATSILIPYCFIPVCAWRDAPLVANYLNSWREFQISYLKVTGSHLHLDLKPYIYIGTFIIVNSAFSSIHLTYCFFPIYPGPVYTIPYTLNGVLNCCVLFVWLTACAALCSAGDKLARCFEKAVSNSTTRVQVLQDYRRLWLALSELARLTSHAIYRSGCVPLAMQMWFITLTLYGSIANLITANYSAFFIYVTMSHSILGLFFLFCNHGYWVPVKIQSKMQIELEKRNSMNSSGSDMDEVNDFLQAISMNPPIMSLGGYVTVDRHMFQAACATVVTYLIVLVQFRMTSSSIFDVR